MTDHRCGTCRHFTQGDGYSGLCQIGVFLGRGTAFSGESGCPGWLPIESRGDAPDKLWVVIDTRGHLVGTYRTPADAGKAAGWGASIVEYAHGMDEVSYRRGWRDAIAAAVATVSGETCMDCAGLSQLVETLTPEG